MATYEFDVVPVDQDGSKAFNDDVKTWQAIEAFLNTRGALGWQAVVSLDTTRPRQLILEKTTAEGLGRVVTVAKSGGDFDNIQGAINYAIANYTLDSNNFVVIKVYPGTYTEQLTTTSQYIRIIGVSADPSDQPKPVTLYNTGADAAHYPLAISTGTLYLESITVKTDVGGVFGPVRGSFFTYCHFAGGHFIETAAVAYAYMNLESCTAVDNMFNLTGVAGGGRFIALRDCDIYSAGLPVFGSTGFGGSTGTIKLQDTMCGDVVDVSGEWSVICQGAEFYSGGKLNLDTTGSIFIFGNILSAGLHFISDPLGIKVIVKNSFVGPTNYIGVGEGDITADVAITNVQCSSNIMHNGMDGEIQIVSKEKKVGNGQLCAYRNLQEALNSIWEDDSIVSLGDNVALTETMVLPNFMFTIDGHRIYGICNTAAVHCEMTAGATLTLSRLCCLTGGEYLINGNGARLTLTQCGRMLDFEPVSVRFRIVSGDANTELRVNSCNLQGSSGNHNCIKIDDADPVIVVERSVLRGYTGHPAVHFTVKTVGKWMSKYSTLLHGSGGANTWATVDVAATELRSYQDSFNAGSMLAGDALANATNQISKSSNTNDTAITY